MGYPPDTETTLKYRVFRSVFPDAKLYEFMIFIQAHWVEFFAERGMKQPYSVMEFHEEFDAWLAKKHGYKGGI